MKIGTDIKKLRIKRKMKTQDLAEKAGLSKTTLIALQANKGNPTIATLERIAVALNSTFHCRLKMPAKKGSSKRKAGAAKGSMSSKTKAIVKTSPSRNTTS